METSSSEHMETGNSDGLSELEKVRLYLRTMEEYHKASREYGAAQTELNAVLNRVRLAEGMRGMSALVQEALVLNRMDAA